MDLGAGVGVGGGRGGGGGGGWGCGGCVELGNGGAKYKRSKCVFQEKRGNDLHEC